MNWKYSKRRFAMNRWTYEVRWDGDLTTYKQNFETIEEARIALALHNNRNSRMIITKKEN
jgi:hypothetical protein